MAETVVYLHGAGGASSRGEWFTPLNEGLANLGFSTIDPGGARIVEPKYTQALREGKEAEAPQEFWTRPAEPKYQKAREEYESRRSELLLLTRKWAQGATGGFGRAPVNGRAAALASTFVPDAKLYWKNRRNREAAWQATFRALPKTGHVIVIAHSLGSVLMADMLKRLPQRVTIDMLITIGSPLSIDVFRRQNRSLASDFPSDVVKAWLNVFDPTDPVTIGRGISRHFPEVVDVPVDLGGAHTVAAYCSHPIVASGVASSLYGASVPPSPAEHVPAKQIAEAWHLQLLGYAFSNQLSRTFETKEWRAKSRLDFARHIGASRIVRQIQEGKSDVDLHAAPSEDDFLRHATDLVRDTWPDEALLPFAISLYMSPPARPFDIDVKNGHRERALVALLNRVRRRAGTLTDQEIAEAVAHAVKEANDAMRDGSFPWEVLIGAGVVVLAATGVGLAAAVPAGLVGAAAITSTLAAFGPGGMVGGMITLAALTGAGSAAAGAGVARLAGEPEARDALLMLAAEELSSSAAAELRVTITGMLAVVIAQRPLGFPSSHEQVEAFLLQVRSALQAETRLHQTIAPNRPGTEEWEDKLALVDRALEWLEGWMKKHAQELGTALVLERRSLLKEIEA